MTNVVAQHTETHTAKLQDLQEKHEQRSGSHEAQMSELEQRLQTSLALAETSLVARVDAVQERVVEEGKQTEAKLASVSSSLQDSLQSVRLELSDATRRHDAALGDARQTLLFRLDALEASSVEYQQQSSGRLAVEQQRAESAEQAALAECAALREALDHARKQLQEDIERVSQSSAALVQRTEAVLRDTCAQTEAHVRATDDALQSLQSLVVPAIGETQLAVTAARAEIVAGLLETQQHADRVRTDLLGHTTRLSEATLSLTLIPRDLAGLSHKVAAMQTQIAALRLPSASTGAAADSASSDVSAVADGASVADHLKLISVSDTPLVESGPSSLSTVASSQAQTVTLSDAVPLPSTTVTSVTSAVDPDAEISQ